MIRPNQPKKKPGAVHKLFHFMCSWKPRSKVLAYHGLDPTASQVAANSTILVLIFAELNEYDRPVNESLCETYPHQKCQRTGTSAGLTSSQRSRV
jgi:hypothetical protein